METAIWVAIVATVGLVFTGVGYVVKITRTVSSDINEVKATAVAASNRADIAGIQVAQTSLKVERVATELSAHREATARDYVSNRALENLENRLVDAIGRLGDRFDNLFSRVATPAH